MTTLKTNKTFSKIFKYENIKIIKFPEYTSYYSCKHKLPLMVVEDLKTVLAKKTISFVRADIEDPFQPFEGLGNNCPQYSVADYQIIKKYGSSPGHNAPAGHHKSTMDNWSSTFYHVNMTPQDIMLNAGVWLISEQWCYYISRNNKLRNVIVISGSIPDDKETNLGGELKINNPPFMFKIILTTSSRFSDKNVYVGCLLYPNKPIIPEGEATDIGKYYVPLEKLDDMCDYDIQGFVNQIIKQYKLGFSGYTKKTSTTGKKQTGEIKPLHEIIPIKYDIKDNLKRSLINGKYFGLLINSTSLDELELHWKDYEKLFNEIPNLNRSLDYHREYYDLCKMRLVGSL